MPSNNKHNVSEKELDNLLKQAFLNLDTTNPKNKNIMETVSNQYLNPLSITFYIKNFILNKLVIGFICLAIAIGVGIFFYSEKNTNASSVNLNHSEITISKQEVIPENTSENDKIKSSQLNSDDKDNQERTNAITEPFKKLELSLNEPPQQQEFTKALVNTEKKKLQDDTSYIFPKLTEKEIKATEKQKERMKNWLLKQSKDKYVLIIPKAGHSVMSSIDDTLAMFFMQNAEITNLEYRTFLFDLLIEGEKEAFLKAKPLQYLWLDASGHAKGNMMKDLYFSDKTFNDYPVVNITPEGIELYCKWLNKISNDKIVARLPYENEWVAAAKGKATKVIYPWPGDSIQNKYGCFLANFCIKKLSDKLRPNINIKCIAKNVNAYASAEYMLGDSMMTCKVYSYNPNDYGLFCMTGNVSEMVYSNKTRSVIAKGGSWNTDFEQCKLYNKEELLGIVKANSMTGFRPIFRLNNKPSFGSIDRDSKETGLPTSFNSEEIAFASKEKKKMIDALSKFNKDKYSTIPMGSCIYKKDTISVQSFYMQVTEVTNLEYRTFLADLLIQNRPNDYLIAKPNQEMWMTKFPYSDNVPMSNMYFWHAAYDDYPVVNISRKGAQMYCEWLTNETNKVLKESHKPLIKDLRIPDELEWVYASSNRKYYSKYANGSDLLRDSKGKYEMNFMCYSREQCRYDSKLQLYVPNNEKRTMEEGTHPGFIDDGAFHTTYTKAYKANSYGLFCMAGNVSEMVVNNKTKQPETKGGSWFSCDYFLEIEADDEYKNEINASPLIGFRPVVTFGEVKK